MRLWTPAAAIHANQEASFALRLLSLPKSVVDQNEKADHSQQEPTPPSKLQDNRRQRNSNKRAVPASI